MQRLLTVFLCSGLLGCTVDASNSDDGIVAQSILRTILRGQLVSPLIIDADPPSARGGDALIDGEYDLVASKVFIGRTGDPSSVPASFVTQRLVLDRGLVKLITVSDGATTTETATLAFCGAGLAFTYTSWPTAGTTRALGFGAHGDTLEIYDQNVVNTYQLRAGTRSGIEHAAVGAACKQAPGVCGGLTNVGAWVREQSTAAAAPVATAGELLLETPYVMESDVYYNGAPRSGIRDKVTLVAHADSTFEFVQDLDHQGTTRLSGTFITIGNALTFNISCSPFGTFPLPFTYNARQGILQTLQPGGANHDIGTECMTYHAVK